MPETKPTNKNPLDLSKLNPDIMCQLAQDSKYRHLVNNMQKWHHDAQYALLNADLSTEAGAMFAAKMQERIYILNQIANAADRVMEFKADDERERSKFEEPDSVRNGNDTGKPRQPAPVPMSSIPRGQ